VNLERLRTRSGDECLSDLQLDALALGALGETQTREAERHLASCSRCSERRQALAETTRASADVLARSASSASPVPMRRAARRSARRVWLGGAVGTLAAAAALLLVLGRSPLTESGDTVRSKGTSRVGFFVRHAGVVRRGDDRERVSPGDALRFVVTSSTTTYIAVLSRDGAGQVSVYHPSGPRAARVEPGVERPLETSVVLDDVLGEERLYALACSAPIEVAPVGDSLRRSAAEPAWPGECSVERFVLIKEAAKP
jgi:anti-sigma factor RsiW